MLSSGGSKEVPTIAYISIFACAMLGCAVFLLPAVSSETNVFMLALVAYNSEIIVPAMDIAIVEMTALYPHIKFNHTVFVNPRQELCDVYEDLVGHYVANFYYQRRREDSYFVIVPTGCSTSIMAAADLAREWNVPVIASAGIDTRLANKQRFPSLIRMLPSQNVAFVQCLDALFRLYNWTTISVICDPASTTDYFYDSMCMELPALMRAKHGRYSFSVLATNLSRSDLVTTALTAAGSRSRVIVLLAHMDLVRSCLIAAGPLGMLSKEYVYTTIVFQNVNFILWGSPHWYRNDSFDEIARQAFNSLLIISYARIMHNKQLDDFLTTIEQTALDDFNKTADLSGEKTVYPLCSHTAFRAVAEMINETLAIGLNLSDGIQLAKRMYNRNFDSVDGRPFRVNGNGDRDAFYAVSGVDQPTGTIEELMLFDAYDGSLNASYFNRSWIRIDSIPPNRPYCGYAGEDSRCQVSGLNSADLQLYVILPVVVLAILIAATIATTVLRQKWRKEEEEKIFKLFPDEIFELSGSESDLKLKAGRVRQTASGRRVMFRSHIVWCKESQIARQKGSLSKLEHSMMIHRSRLEHQNIVKFYGICFAPDSTKLLVEYTAKGSLHDILAAEHLADLSREIKYSFIEGILAGLTAIHDSHVSVHGRLNATTCLIDQRLTLKLSSINSSIPLRPVYEKYRMDPETTWKLLYLAPEILKQTEFPDIRPRIEPTQPADIYAFAIVAHQILMQCGPFEMPDPEQIFTLPDQDQTLFVVKQVMDGELMYPMRPPFPVHHKYPLFADVLSDAWAYDPTKRATVKQLHKAIKRIPRFVQNRNLMDSLIHRLKVFADELEDQVDEKTRILEEERARTDELLFQLIPKSIVMSLHNGIIVPPEYFDEVTLAFTAVENFSHIVTTSSPLMVVTFLNSMFSMLDDIIMEFEVYKVETIFDSYMVASGLPVRNGTRHSLEIARMAIQMISRAKQYCHPVDKGSALQLKIGINTGPCAASVVGTKMIRYCLFGDTINTASRMCSFGEALKIHTSTTFYIHVDKGLLPDDWYCVYRGKIEIKGKGSMKTYWLEKNEDSESDLSNISTNCSTILPD